MTKPAFMLSIETLSIPQQTYLSITGPVFYLRIRKQLSTYVAVLRRQLLPEIIDNKGNIAVRFEEGGQRENFDSLRRI